MLTLGCIVGLLAVCELASTLSWVYNIFDYVVPFAPTLRWTFPLIDLNLFNLSYPLTPWLFIVFLYSWVWIPAAKIALSRISALKSLFPRFVGSGPPPAHSEPSGRRLKSKHLTLGLLLSAATAAFITIYPYIHLPSSTLVGADSVDYYKALTDMVREGPLTVLQNDRPAFNFLMYAFKYVTALSPEIVVKIIPILLSVCLGLSVFWFVRMGTKDERLAVVSSLFSSFSFQTIVGVYAAFYANWLALIESFVLLGLLLRSLEKSSWKLALVSTLVGVTILLTHPYTWDVLMVVLFFFLAWMFLKRKSEGNFGFGMLTFVLAANLMFYVAYSLSPFGKGVSQGAQLAVQGSSWSLSVQSVLNLENNLASTVQNYVGGLLANPLLIVLAVAGMFSISDFTKKFNRLMLLWIMVPSLALLAVSPDPFYIRLMYLIPIQILAAAGLCWILDRVDRFISRFDASKVSSMLKSLVIVLAVLLLLNYALRSVDGTLLQML